MKIQSVKRVYFSPASTTQTIVDEIARHFAPEKESWDLLREGIESERSVEADSLVVVGMPVYAGRIPPRCAEMLAKLKGKRTPAIAVVVYGNRDYDDALVELKDILEASGFVVVGAGAFIARHSIFPAVAGSRPDAEDKKIAAHFAERCAELLESADGLENTRLQVKGNVPYKKAKTVPLKPSADGKCNRCGACVPLCPSGAIPQDAPHRTDKSRCIACTACIQVCPRQARAFRGFVYSIVGRLFGKKYSARKEPELFFP